MTAERIRVGIVGAGANTRARHIPGLQALDRVELVSVCNRTEESSQAAAREAGIRRIYSNWRELVEADDTNAIVIGTWPYLHCPITLAALECGKHVLCEARMAMDASEARRMNEAARRHPKLVTQVVPAPLTLPFDNTIRTLIDEGFVGDVLSLEVRATGGTFIGPDPAMGWRQDRALSGFNTMSLGIWYECVMRWIGEATAVMAKGRTFVKQRRDADGAWRAATVPDHLDVLADMACGAQARFSISQVMGHVKSECVHLCGSEGTLSLHDGRLFAGRKHDAAMNEIHIPESERGAWRVEEEFVHAIRGLEPVRLTRFEDGVKYMEFTEAAIRSMAERREIPLPL
jgi:predicted dehydrogenase